MIEKIWLYIRLKFIFRRIGHKRRFLDQIAELYGLKRNKWERNKKLCLRIIEYIQKPLREK